MLRVVVLPVLIVLLPFPRPALGDCTFEWQEPYSARTFFGYACRDDCAPQKAGFHWAERHGITDPAACDGFADAHADLSAVVEGCRAFAQERLTPEDAGHAWALENEISQPCLCQGASGGFRDGCERHVAAR